MEKDGEKEKREEILEKIKKASNEEYKTTWDEAGNVILKKKSEIKKGSKSRAKGASFELQVRKDLEEKNWIVAKWTNNVDLVVRKVVQAKRKFNPFNKVMTIGTGFPDFFSFQLLSEGKYNVVGVEVKVNGLLSREEKEKCRFLLEKKVFNEIWIAKKQEGKIEYINFGEKWGK